MKKLTESKTSVNREQQRLQIQGVSKKRGPFL